ncbi:MAG: hypothetical protein JST35_12840 [Armatimonadetes bacterium]|nr:hypothetical protein [Armatimonadota bacterium]
MLRRLFSWTIALTALSVGAQAQNGYAQRTQEIRAGIVVLEGSRVNNNAANPPANDTPFVWLNCDQNTAAKPAGWKFFNPNAPGVATQAIVTRWSAINTLIGSPNPGPTLGESVTKRMAAYWEVNLTTATDQQIADYDVLLVPAYRNTSLNPAEREKLRRFVDSGGVLWVDFNVSNSTAIDQSNNFPVPFLAQNGGGLENSFDQFHPLVSFPNPISITSIRSFASDGNQGTIGNVTFAGLGGIGALNMPLPEESLRLQSVAATAAGPTISVAQSGDGFVVVTARGYAQTLNNLQNTSRVVVNNYGYRANGGSFTRTQDALVKFVVNLVSLPTGSPQISQGAHKQSSSAVDVSAPLLKRFDTDVIPGGVPQGSIYRGLLVVSTGNTVRVYDANPSSDLDGDGNADDGTPDYAGGSAMDLIWESSALPGPISSPTCTEVANPAGVPKDQILVVDGNGRLVAFDAFPTNANGQLQAGPIAPAYVVAPPSAPAGVDPIVNAPLPPTVQDGVVFVADQIPPPGFGSTNVGRVWLADPRLGTDISSGGRFQVGSGVLPTFSNSVTVGYIPIADNSGGLDRVVYGPGVANGTSYQSATLVSLWLGAKGENPPPSALSVVTVGPNSYLSVQTRASRQGLPIRIPASLGAGSHLGVKLSIIDQNGDPWTSAQMASAFDGTVVQATPGELRFGLTGPLPTLPSGQIAVGVRVDYTIDWGGILPALQGQVVRGTLSMPDDFNLQASDRRRFIGSLALSPRGTIYAVQSTAARNFAGGFINPSQTGGSFYAIREEGRGNFRVLNRYDLYPPHTVQLSGGATASYSATFEDNDELTQIPQAAILAGQFQNLTFTGGPAIRNGTVYVTAMGNKGNIPFIPYTILMAFRGEGESPNIRLSSFPDGSSIVQPDFIQSAGGNKRTPNRYSTLTPSQYTWDQTQSVLTINSLANVTRGQITGAISTSQPVILKSPNGAPDQIFYPDANNSNWNPLLWYVVLHGDASRTAPFVTGNTVFLASSSALPDILTRGFSNPFTLQTYVMGNALSADVSGSDPFLIPNTARPWVSQISRLRVRGTDVEGNPDVRWPQYVGLESFENFVQRLFQTVIGSPSSGYSRRDAAIFGGDKALVIAGGTTNAGGVFTGSQFGAFSRADLLVADQGRVGRFDPAGNPIWSTDSTENFGTVDVNGSSRAQDLVRPTRAYIASPSDIVVVDSGASRVIRFDQSGRETRSIKNFRVDDNFVPDGFKGGDPTSLSSPSDVSFFGEFVIQANNLFTGAQPVEYWAHYVVADAGNRRIVDIVDRYSVDANRRISDPIQLGTLFWHSPSLYSGKNFQYTSITRLKVDPLNAASPYYYVAGIGSAMPTRTDAGLDSPALNGQRQTEGGNGGIVILNPFNPAANIVINEVLVPAIGANALWNEDTATFSSPAYAAQQKKLSTLYSVTARTEGNAPAIMFTDATGIYEMVQNAGVWTVRWMLPNSVYRVMRGIRNTYDTTLSAPFNTPGVPSTSNAADLNAVYARRLDSGEVIVVNAYNGTTRGIRQANGTFLGRVALPGEILQIDGFIDPLAVDPANPNRNYGFSFLKTNLGFGRLSIRYELPPISGARGILQPIFADRR